MADPEKIKQVFIGALDQPPAGRSAWLDQACGGDAGLRGEVEELLAALARRPVLDSSLLATESTAGLPSALSEGPGTLINQYKLLQQIGEGGFGSVFMAEQEYPVRRRVALKIIKLGMDTRHVIARFEQERQALAMMDHPNIARVFDAGATSTGRPFFVMELVRGVPITEYCDTQHLTASQRLELFIPVCHAIQHAHQKGILHRDIKPSNVLVTLHDGRPVPKVIDFGVAKATNQRLTEKTLFTEFRAMIGTPAYMSPEQAEMSGLDIDTRTDVYSLGVLLYELLTGTTPFDMKTLLEAGYAEMQRIIREVEPQRPSLRLSTLAGLLPGVAAQRGIEPAKLSRLVRGDLDWIVMRCLEKDRTRRYETANALAMDMQRHLDGEPIVAAPPSAAYRVRKFVRRHRVGVLAGVAIALTLLLGVIGTTAGLLWAVREARIARSQWDMAQQVAGFMGETLRGAAPSAARGRDPTMLREMLDAAAAKIEKGELKDSPEAELQLRHSIGVTYGSLGDHDAAERILGPLLNLSRTTFGEESEWAAAALLEQGALLRARGRPQEALARLEEALAMRRRLLSGDHWAVAEAVNNVGLLLQELGRFSEALLRYQEALEIRQRLFPGDHQQVAMSLNNVGRCLQDLGRAQEALPLIQAALAMSQRLVKGDHPDVAMALNNVGYCLQALGRAAEAMALHESALAMFRKVHGGDHPSIAATLSNVGSCLRRLGRVEEALPRYQEAVEMIQKLRRGDHPEVVQMLDDLGSCLMALGRPGDALVRYQTSLEMKERLWKGDHPQVAKALENTAACLRALGRPAEALPRYEAARAMLLRLYPEGNPALPSCLNGLADCLDALGRGAEALARRREALEIFRRSAPADSPALAAALAQVGQALLKAGTPAAAAEAEPLLRECLSIRQKAFPEGHAQAWLRHNSASLLGGSLVAAAADPAMSAEVRLARLREAEPLLLGAYAALKDDPRVPPPAVVGADRRREALERIPALYRAWEQAEPGKGHLQRVAEWQSAMEKPGDGHPISGKPGDRP